MGGGQVHFCKLVMVGHEAPRSIIRDEQCEQSVIMSVSRGAGGAGCRDVGGPHSAGSFSSESGSNQVPQACLLHFMPSIQPRLLSFITTSACIGPIALYC
jgi:hypothetical protein